MNFMGSNSTPLTKMRFSSLFLNFVDTTFFILIFLLDKLPMGDTCFNKFKKSDTYFKNTRSRDILLTFSINFNRVRVKLEKYLSFSWGRRDKNIIFIYCFTIHKRSNSICSQISSIQQVIFLRNYVWFNQKKCPIN